MRHRILLFAAVLLSPFAHGSTVVVQNSEFEFDHSELLLADYDGGPLRDGFIALIGIPEGNPIPWNAATLRRAARVGLANEPVPVLPNSPGESGLLYVELEIANSGEWNDIPLYLFIGNSPNVWTSRYFAILDTDLRLSTSHPDQYPLKYRMTREDVVRGAIGFETVDTSPLGGPSQYSSIGLSFIPEPASSGLLALSTIILVLRRGGRS